MTGVDFLEKSSGGWGIRKIPPSTLQLLGAREFALIFCIPSALFVLKKFMTKLSCLEPICVRCLEICTQKFPKLSGFYTLTHKVVRFRLCMYSIFDTLSDAGKISSTLVFNVIHKRLSFLFSSRIGKIEWLGVLILQLVSSGVSFFLILILTMNNEDSWQN